MNPFREMVLLPLETYKNLRKKVLGGTPMQKDLFDLRERYGDSLPEDQRLKLESEVISKHSTHVKPELEVTPHAAAPDNSIIKSTIDNFARTNKNRAQQLFNYLEMTFRSAPKWNDKGELLNETNIPLPGTNIVELINFVTAARFRKAPINGMEEFIEMLEIANVPSYLYSAKGAEALLNYKQSRAETREFAEKSFHDEQEWQSLNE